MNEWRQLSLVKSQHCFESFGNDKTFLRHWHPIFDNKEHLRKYCKSWYILHRLFWGSSKLWGAQDCKKKFTRCWKSVIPKKYTEKLEKYMRIYTFVKENENKTDPEVKWRQRETYDKFAGDFVGIWWLFAGRCELIIRFLCSVSLKKSDTQGKPGSAYYKTRGVFSPNYQWRSNPMLNKCLSCFWNGCYRWPRPHENLMFVSKKIQKIVWRH